MFQRHSRSCSISAWAMLFLITVWQLFRVFGGPITEAENPWVAVARSALFALLIGYAKPIFLMVLDIARAPYTALMEITYDGRGFYLCRSGTGSDKRTDNDCV